MGNAPEPQEDAVWHEWPEASDQWPVYYLGTQAHQWRNGREGGAWLAGLVNAIPEKCARIEIETDWIAGAVLAMIEGGLRVGPYSIGEKTSTLEVAVAYMSWGPERIHGSAYAPAVPLGA